MNDEERKQIQNEMEKEHKYRQVKSLHCDRPFETRIFGRWITIRSNKEIIQWLRIRDKRMKKERRK